MYSRFMKQIFHHIYRSLRNDVNGVIERARTSKLIGSSQETQIYLFTNDSCVKDLLLKIKGDGDFLSTNCSTNEVDDLRFILLVSQITIVDTPEEIIDICPDFNVCGATESGINVGIVPASGMKCERCWYYSESIEEDGESTCDSPYHDVCPRCEKVMIQNIRT